MADNYQPKEQENKPKNRSLTGFIVVIIILIGLIGFITWLYIDQKKTTMVITEELSEEKDSLRTEFIELKTEYDSLKTDNDSLNTQLDSEKERIDNILTELKNVKATNYSKIKELKNELSTLRKIAKSYVRQIDSLNTLNKQLERENKEVKEDLVKTKESKEKLEKEKEDLSKQVTKAKVLRAENIQPIPINKRGKEKAKVDKVNKIKVNFTVDENALAEKGERYFYIRIAAPPDDFILTNSEDNLFEFNNKKIVYSARRKINYDGNETKATIYFDTQGELKPGEYEVYIFADGAQIGESSFTLEESGWLFF